MVDPERFDADPDPDPTFQADADPAPDPDPNNFTRVRNFFLQIFNYCFQSLLNLSCVISQQECGRKGEG